VRGCGGAGVRGCGGAEVRGGGGAGVIVRGRWCRRGRGGPDVLLHASRWRPVCPSDERAVVACSLARFARLHAVVAVASAASGSGPEAAARNPVMRSHPAAKMIRFPRLANLPRPE